MSLFFDHNATTLIRRSALDLAVSVMAETGNAASVHSFGRQAARHVETARRKIAGTLAVDPGQVVFNSGATEGNNTILRAFAERRILVSAIEHPSVLESGVEAETIPVTKDGVVDLAALADLLRATPQPALVSVMLVNNETGVIQPVAEIARMSRAAGAMVHCDAVQGFGRIPVTRESLGVDFMTISAHKIGGMQGVGALVFAPGIQVPRLIQGGGQEKRLRGGTVNVAGIASFGEAALEACGNLEAFAQLSVLRERIESHITGYPGVTILGRGADRVSNTVMATVEGVSGDTCLMAFDLEGVALSAGSACSSGATRLSATLRAMGIPENKTLSSLRMSLGHSSTEKEVDEFLRVWDKVMPRLLGNRP